MRNSAAAAVSAARFVLPRPVNPSLFQDDEATLATPAAQTPRELPVPVGGSSLLFTTTTRRTTLNSGQWAGPVVEIKRYSGMAPRCCSCSCTADFASLSEEDSSPSRRGAHFSFTKATAGLYSPLLLLLSAEERGRSKSLLEVEKRHEEGALLWSRWSAARSASTASAKTLAFLRPPRASKSRDKRR
jgi:hypothetical protein